MIKKYLILLITTIIILVVKSEGGDATSTSSTEELPLIKVGKYGLNETLYWGTYRPHTYFGMKTRSIKPINTGLIWSTPNIGNSFNRMLYKVEQGGDGVGTYNWKKHDGKNFGIQEIKDLKGHLNLTTSFIKTNNGNDWSVRISGTSNYTSSKLPSQNPLVSLIYYIHDESIQQDDFNSGLKISDTNSKDLQIKGEHPEIGKYTLYFSNPDQSSTCNQKEIVDKYNLINGQSSICNWRYYGVSKFNSANNWDPIKNLFDQETNVHITPLYTEWTKSRMMAEGGKAFIPTLPNKVQSKSNNIIAVQRVLQVPFDIEISFVSNEKNGSGKNGELSDIQIEKIVKSLLTGNAFNEKFSQYEKEFDNKFNLKFLSEKLRKHKSTVYQLTMESLSNLLGGFGYWHGSSITKPLGQNDGVTTLKTKPVSLFSATPSRPAFPRGFLWDEGFHQLLASTYDVDLTIESLSHWLNIMDENGWIPREQILGHEAASMVPPEFRIQLQNIANPPSIIFSVNKLLEMLISFKSKGGQVVNGGIGSVNIPGGNLSILIEQQDVEKIESFLIESLPRIEKFYQYYWDTQSSVVEGSFRWRGRKVNHTLASGLDDYPRAAIPSLLEVHVDLCSWMAFFSKSLSTITNYLGKETKSLYYYNQFKLIANNIESLHWNEKDSLFYDIIMHKNGTKEWIKTQGYMNYFPFFLGVLEKHSPTITPLLTTLKDINGVWSRYGIRSMSLADPSYGTHENYWKGPIWININYLFLHSMNKIYLSDLSVTECYQTLRFNVLANIDTQYTKTGFLWEQYDPENGDGKRNHPFSGWTSLFALIVSEQF